MSQADACIGFVCTRPEQIVESLASAVRSLDLSAENAEAMVDLFARAERLCVAARTLAAGHVRSWRSSGYRTAAEWLASRTQSSLSEAITSLQTAQGLERVPATREAFVSGTLSGAQAAEITAAAAADPASEPALLRAATASSLAQLREECRTVRAAAAGDENAFERIRMSRYLRHWTDRDGAVRLDARLTPDAGAAVIAAVTATAAASATDARKNGHREPLEAHKADALVALCTGDGRSEQVVHVHVDQPAFARGRTVAGERCSIPGVGPIGVAAARRIAGDGIVKAIEKNGVDVTRVAHLGRTIPAHLRTALEARDQACAVQGCDARMGLEIDHIVPFAQGGPTRLSNLARLCSFHHAQKTHHGWTLGGRPGEWTWTRPERAPPVPAP